VKKEKPHRVGLGVELPGRLQKALAGQGDRPRHITLEFACAE